MQSSRSRYRHIQPETPMDMLRASTEAGMASMRRALNKQKEEKRIAKGHCSYCGKEGGNAPLKGCSRCKAARYCDQTCQLGDFNARHKRECANFASPPTTSVFLMKPIENDRYPQHPIFAFWHEDGVGCWVSVAGRIDCDLHTLTDTIDPTGYSARQERMMAEGGAAGREIIRTHKAAARSVVGLRVLIQNRRKDKTPVVFFASRAQVVSQPSLTAAVERGAAARDNMVKFTKDKVARVALGVANDPWDNVPRLQVSYLNGAEMKKDAPPSANIKDANNGFVLLNTGEYAILHLQFRVGDGDMISKDWEALGALEAIYLPWAPWDGSTPLDATAASLPSAHAHSLANPTADGSDSTAHAGKLLRAPFDQRAIRSYYADFIERGEEAYMRSHYGDARADMARNADEMMAAMGEMLLSQVAQAGNTDILVRRLRDCGMGELADKVAAQ
ncbi:hypothetical protein C8Q77DRAFT_1100288 [Trametes polyzona]|nr:hypothetical protein C8Q77DRAFT_1100288 [Trametes polyzona]